VILVNRSLANQYFPGVSPVGRRLKLGLNDIHGEIVGVVGDVRHRKLEKAGGPEYYVPFSQVALNSMSIVMRGKLDTGIGSSLRAAVQELDKDLPVFQVRSMESLVSDAMARQRFSTTLFGAFAGVALVLAAAGLFSVMSFLVAQRTHEIGVRMALGAQRRDVLRLIMGKGVALVLAGIGAGLAGALGLTRLMQGLLFGVGATDPPTFASISLILVAVALLACYLPARRASRVDPMVSLRCE
jgi:putative ABC transport system permease protein